MRTRGWRRIGTAIVRWPGPVLVVGVRVGAHRSARVAGIQDQLRHSPVYARQRAGQCRLHGRRTPLFPGPAEARIADDRNRSRHAQPGRHARPGPGGQGGVPRTRRRPGADHHPATGHADRPQLDRVSDQRITAPPSRKPEVPDGSRRRPAEAGRRADEDDRHSEAAVHAAAGSSPPPPRARPKASTTPSPRSTTCATSSRISTTSSGRFAVISTGRSIASTSRCAWRSDRCSTRSTASTSSVKSSRTSRRVWTSSMRCSRNWWR